ncbi:hypothetical protein ACIBG8_27410 [Nonomuraea sp. NPDC050556]|uniref:hypothetical protein n=1 Tax=Nonomuraea sp. NPDC050556 TaxID=3364369 RepID=UPI0037ACA67C
MPAPVSNARWMLYAQAFFMALIAVAYLVFAQAAFGACALVIAASYVWLASRLARADRRTLILTVIVQSVVWVGYTALVIRKNVIGPDHDLTDFLTPLIWFPPIVIGLLLYAQAWFKPHVE